MAERKRKANKEITHIVTPGSTIRFEEPKSKRGQPKQKVTVVVAQELNPASGFLNFIREHAVVSVAVGFVIASQAQILIRALIDNFINPLYGLLFNTQSLNKQTVTLHFHDRAAPVNWGIIITTLINFLFVLLAIYMLIKIFNLDKLDKKDDTKK
jgi:large conductance mechanosensitive channel protein